MTDAPPGPVSELVPETETEPETEPIPEPAPSTVPVSMYDIFTSMYRVIKKNVP